MVSEPSTCRKYVPNMQKEEETVMKSKRGDCDFIQYTFHAVHISYSTHFPYSCFAFSKPSWSHEIGVLTAALLTIQVFGNAASCLLISNVNKCGPRNPWMLDYTALKMKALRTLETVVIVY